MSIFFLRLNQVFWRVLHCLPGSLCRLQHGFKQNIFNCIKQNVLYVHIPRFGFLRTEANSYSFFFSFFPWVYEWYQLINVRPKQVEKIKRWVLECGRGLFCTLSFEKRGQWEPKDSEERRPSSETKARKKWDDVEDVPCIGFTISL